jgi:Polysaccharide biosynthesis enzyme WcbI
MKKRWLVIFNCQSSGLGNSLSLLCPQADIDICDLVRFRADADHWKTKISDYDHLIVIPEIQKQGIMDFSSLPNVTWVPGVYFRGFHPDLSYVTCGATQVKGPLDDYHSIIIFAAFKQGLDEVQTRRLFAHDFYEKAGFFSIWEAERNALFERFESYGINIRANFVGWMRNGGFMHSINHARINVVYDIATIVAKKLVDGAIVEGGIIPHDHLKLGPIYPIFPEIAERYAAGRGSYQFKPSGGYKLLNLNEFIDASFEVYKNFKIEDLQAGNPHYAVAVKLISGTV